MRRLRQLIYKAGSEPRQSVKRFAFGLSLFAIAAGLIVYGYLHTPMFQVPGLILLVPAFFFAGWGYLGIFANRFSQVLKSRR